MVQHRSRQVGVGHNPIRLQNRVHVNTSQVRSHEGDSGPVLCLSEESLGRRDQGPPSKASNRGGPSGRIPVPLQVQLLSGPQEARQLASDLELEASQQKIHKASKIPHGNPRLDHSSVSPRHVGHYHRLKGRLLTHSDPSSSSTLLGFPLQACGLQVPGSSVRFINSPESVYQGVKSRVSLSQKERSDPLCLHRRLAHSREIPTRLPRVNRLRRSDSSRPRLGHQSRQVGPPAFTIGSLPGGSPRFPAGFCSANLGTHLSCGSSSGTSVVTPCSRCPPLASIPGSGSQSRGNPPVLQTSHEANPVSSPPTLQPEFRSSLSSDPVVSGPQAIPNLVDSELQPTQGETFCRQQALGNPHHRRLQRRLGCNMGVQVNVRSLVTTGETAAHQRPRTSCCQEGHSQLVQRSQGPQHLNSVGQFHHCVVPEPPRGDEVPQSLPSNLGSPTPVPICRHLGESDPPSRETERDGGCFVQGSLQSARMGTQPVLGRLRLRDFRPPSSRPICVTSQLQAPDVRLQVPSPPRLGSGRSLLQLGQPVSVCFPTVPSSSKSSVEAQSVVGQHDSHSPLLAKTTVVPAHPSHARGPTLSVSGGSIPSISSETQNPPPRPPVSASSCLETINRRFLSEGLSQRAADLAAKSRRDTTIATYDSRLEKFYSWAKANSVNPVEAPVEDLCSFFVSLFDEGKQVSTIRNYRSAISAIHLGFSDGSSLGTNHTIVSLLKGMFHQRPPRHRLAPSWSINDVLAALSSEPYEPIHNAPLDAMTKKTVFLVAVASARRRSEIHALSVDPGFIRFSPDGVYLLPNPSFLAKNQSESFSPTPMFLPTMSSASSIREDRFVCPVRALKWYVEKTKALRTTNALFLIPRSPYSAASKDTISRWLVELISPFAAPDSHPRAHDVRASASSAAWFRGVPLTDILRAASWKTPSTFVSRYLTNVVSADARFARSVLRGSGSSQGLPPTSRC